MTVALIGGAASAEQTKVGSAGAQYLKISVGSRYQGMGEAAVAVANDVYAMYWNPAGLVEIENSAVGFTRVDWLLDVELNYIAGAKYFEDIGVFGLSATILSMDKLEITNFENQDGTGDFYSASSWAIGASFARQLTSQFAFGLTAKYLGEKIHHETASGVAFDFGTQLYTGFRTLRLAMAITNMGPDMQFSGDDLDVRYDGRAGQGQNDAIGASLKTTPYKLPMTFRVGMAYDFTLSPKAILTIATELKHPNDNLQQGALGGELRVMDKFFVRSGYKFNYDEQSLALGGGLATRIFGETSLHVDYSWEDFGRLESSQRFSLGFSF